MEWIELEHPGIMLKEDYLDEMGIKPGTLAKAIGMDRAAIKRICDGERDISAETSMRLGEFFGVSYEFWHNVQKDYDMRMAKRASLKKVRAEVTPMKAA